MKIIHCKNHLHSEHPVTRSYITSWEDFKLLSSLIFTSRLIKRWLKNGSNFPDVFVLFESIYTSVADSRKIEHDCRNYRWAPISFSVNSDYSGEMHAHSFALRKKYVILLRHHTSYIRWKQVEALRLSYLCWQINFHTMFQVGRY